MQMSSPVPRFISRVSVTFKLWNLMGFETVRSVPSRDRLVVRTLRCGRSNPGSNPGHGINSSNFFFSIILSRMNTIKVFL